MLSYMLPVEEKTSPRNLNLNLNLNGNSNENDEKLIDQSSNKLINFERASVLKNSDITNGASHSQKMDTVASDNAMNSILCSTHNSGDDRKAKMAKVGMPKNVTLKR
ncbi:hypothetical protein Bhyg_11802 [Pseudolycoriella hygida]|uniref:Uncharacterized protein n=1 Tax=Pseudolycoriella hygida TaxID=35572 RepID=A0A9Q0S0N8_9DIPT|nr:hypothetical protein Bhyg_11802 [Pseudolycoriella hygida]